MTISLVRDPFCFVGTSGSEKHSNSEVGYRGLDEGELRRMEAELSAVRDSEETDSEDFETAVDQILTFQREDGSFSFFSDYRMDSDCRVQYVYRPSYACCQILMRAAVAQKGDLRGRPELYRALSDGLGFCCKRGLSGHGYGAEEEQIEDLRNFMKAGYFEFSRRFPDVCPAFCGMVDSIISSYESRLRECKTVFGFGNDLTAEMANLVEAFGREVSIPVFVYGTLVEGMSNADMLNGCAHLGMARLSGYDLFDLGAFPGIMPSGDDGHVLGELRVVDARALSALDELEGNGSLYQRVAVDVCVTNPFGETPNRSRAWAYVYLGKAARGSRIPEQLQPWPLAHALRDTHVWYVAYGSNMCYERFSYYLAGGACEDNGQTYRGCSDKTPPLCSVAVPVMHDVYFGNESMSWGGSGVAFLDADNPGFARARAYLISREQFEQVHDQEGRGGQWYGREVELGKCAGIPMVTFTSKERRPQNAPSRAYLDVIRRGLREAYPHLCDEVTQGMPKIGA